MRLSSVQRRIDSLSLALDAKFVNSGAERSAGGMTGDVVRPTRKTPRNKNTPKDVPPGRLFNEWRWLA
jgi:hypothetical protein